MLCVEWIRSESSQVTQHQQQKKNSRAQQATQTNIHLQRFESFRFGVCEHLFQRRVARELCNVARRADDVSTRKRIRAVHEQETRNRHVVVLDGKVQRGPAEQRVARVEKVWIVAHLQHETRRELVARLAGDVQQRVGRGHNRLLLVRGEQLTQCLVVLRKRRRLGLAAQRRRPRAHVVRRRHAVVGRSAERNVRLLQQHPQRAQLAARGRADERREAESAQTPPTPQ